MHFCLTTYKLQYKKVIGIVIGLAIGFLLGIDDLITRLSRTFDKTRLQLYDGSGNVMRRVESLKGLGITPKKQLKGLEEINTLER